MLKKILVAMELDDSSEVGEHALELARLSGGTVNLLHAIEPIDGTTEEDSDTEAFYRKLEARAATRMEAWTTRCADAGIPCETTVQVGRRWQVIIATATSWEADLIVVGSRPTVRDGKPHLGSTSHQVFFAANCPVYVVRSAE